MKATIHYETEYVYGCEVGFSSHVFRLFPRLDTHISIVDQRFKTEPEARIHERRDLFDNCVASCFYVGRSRRLSARLQLQLELRERNPFGFLLAPHALNIPFRYEPEEARILTPFLIPAAARSDQPFWQTPVTPRPTVETLADLTRTIHQALNYERRDEGAAQSAAQTLQLGKGACRDFAVLQVEILRHAGIAARLASGYLCESGSEDNRARGSLHAWIEAYLPGAGWLGMDPTNGIMCDHHHIAAAVGYAPEDISPVAGSYYSDTPVASQMSSKLEIALE